MVKVELGQFALLMVMLTIYGCGVNKNENSLNDQLDTETISEQHLEQAHLIDNLNIDGNQYTTDEIVQGLEGIDGLSFQRDDDIIELFFGDVSIYFDNREVFDQSSIGAKKNLSYSERALAGCDNPITQKSVLFLFPFGSEYVETESFDNDVYYKLIDHGYCVDIYTRNDVDYERMLETDNYNLVYITTHSNEKGVLILNREHQCSDLPECLKMIQSGEIVLRKNEGEYISLTNWDTYRAIRPEFFSSIGVNYSRKQTTLFVAGCNSLKYDHGQLVTNFLNAGGYGVIGFRTFSNLGWAEYLNKEFFAQLLSEDVSVKDAVFNTVENLRNGVIETFSIYFGLFPEADIKSLHMQTHREYDIFFNSNEIVDNTPNGVAANNITSGFISFPGGTTPENAAIRIVPESFQQDNGEPNYGDGLRCKIQPDGSWGNNQCLIESESNKSAFTQDSRYQVIIFNDQNNSSHWERDESSYCFFGNAATWNSWAFIDCNSINNSGVLDPPQNVISLGASSNSSTGITTWGISWDFVQGATSYNVYISEETGITLENFNSSGGVKIENIQPPYEINWLNSNNQYFAIVTAINSMGESAESSEVNPRSGGGGGSSPTFQ